MADTILPPITETLKVRFWAKVQKSTQEECWIWMGAKDQKGYGRISVSRNGKSIPLLATHIALAISGKQRPPKHLARHSCDNPTCVNPSHLRWGTQKENMADMFERGRNVPAHEHSETMRRVAARGERHVCAKFAAQTIEAIRQDARLHREIAKDYGVSRQYVSELKRGVKRAHG